VGRRGGGGNPLTEVTVNSKEENFCPNYVQEFGLRNNRNILEQERKYNWRGSGTGKIEENET
jgi:hypothetical protein